jgi:uroporphyrinogen-III synthase
MAAALASQGAHPFSFPLIAHEPVVLGPETEQALRALGSYDCLVFTSATAVDCFAALQRQCRAGIPLPPIAAVGPATARAVAKELVEPALVSSIRTGGGLAAELVSAGMLGRILLPAADVADPSLATELRKAGATVQLLTVYRTVPGPAAAALAAAIGAGGIDVVLLASPSAARALARGLEADPGQPDAPPVVCIGPTTAREAVRLGLEVVAVAAEPSRQELLTALWEWTLRNPERRHAAVQ